MQVVGSMEVPDIQGTKTENIRAYFREQRLRQRQGVEVLLEEVAVNQEVIDAERRRYSFAIGRQ